MKIKRIKKMLQMALLDLQERDPEGGWEYAALDQDWSAYAYNGAPEPSLGRYSVAVKGQRLDVRHLFTVSSWVDRSNWDKTLIHVPMKKTD